MRWLIAVWLLVLPAFAAWHYFGPGRSYLQADDAADHLAAARRAADAGDWDAAVAAYTTALDRLPAGRAQDAHRIRLDRSVAKLRGRTFAEGRDELAEQVDELTRTAGADEATLDSARAALAYSRHHSGWLMRLEGKSAAVWQAEVEAARQHYRAAAERAAARGDTTAAGRLRDDLEATVRLARLDLNDLQGKDLPEELKDSSSDGEGKEDGKDQGKGKGKAKGKGKGEGEGEGEGDNPGLGRGREGMKDARGASAGPPPDKGGH